MSENIRLLNPQQVANFDVEYIDSALFRLVCSIVDQNISNPNQARFLDVGGGNGLYADKLLAQYSGCYVDIVEPDSHMNAKNKPNNHKILINSIYQQFKGTQDYDMIQFNWVLHHFIAPSYTQTHAIQLEGLKSAYNMLGPEGIVIIFENFHEGKDHSNAPGQLIYRLTSSKLLKPLTSQMGANTAGVGVCFNSELHWREQLIKAGFNSVFSAHCYDFGDLSPLKKWILSIEN
ncbi:class I SAM-dependent methyltransferase [Vibrio pectenicida]|uniref:Class I SAM-dependent methyltransferase n=1 Tax=Vibrio pectenicida TaxID=62763 RepID=A0A7Y4A272_9VIBR|nr:methyltransferase domain-containing protein [Vibrio pectenicida]NOH72524.1 class I SAM-dependent methyltransferase [Vibrio pectenicida]